MQLVDFLAWSGMLFSVGIFFLLANERSANPLTIEGALLADRRATANQFGTSLAAASTSLATVIIFFIGSAETYGLALLWCGLTYLIGQGVFIYWFSKQSISTEDLTTNADFILDQLGSKSVARVASLLTSTAFCIILFLEFYVGSEILNYYIGGDTPLYRFLSFFALGAIVFVYVRMGGLRVVLRTDAWQTYLMLAACMALLVYALMHEPSVASTETHSQPVALSLLGKASPGQLWVFMAWIAIINLTLPFTQLSSWQRLAATKSVKAAWKGFLTWIPGFLVIWWVPVISLVILNQQGAVPSSLSELFTILRDAPQEVSLILFPIIFVGFASALFSTADTALVALQFSIADRSTPISDISKSDNERSIGRFLLFSSAIIFTILSLIFALAEQNLGAWFFPLIYAVFSQLGILAPLIIYGLLIRSGKVDRATEIQPMPIIVGLVLAWIVLIGSAVTVALGIFVGKFGIQEFATYLAILLSTIGLVIGLKLGKRKATNAL